MHLGEEEVARTWPEDQVCAPGVFQKQRGVPVAGASEDGRLTANGTGERKGLGHHLEPWLLLWGKWAAWQDFEQKDDMISNIKILEIKMNLKSFHFLMF